MSARKSTDRPVTEQTILSELARVKVLFQARAISAVLGAPPVIVELPASEARK